MTTDAESVSTSLGVIGELLGFTFRSLRNFSKRFSAYFLSEACNGLGKSGIFQGAASSTRATATAAMEAIPTTPAAVVAETAMASVGIGT